MRPWQGRPHAALSTAPHAGRCFKAESYWMCIPEIAREITSCWISAVPSKMS
jgi:hypothetical protein